VKRSLLQTTLDLDVSRETRQRLDDFVDLLIRWSPAINLIGDADRPAIWARHVADSLQLLPLLRGRPPPAIDLGSGAGFPGLVLAITSGHHFHLIEADQRKAAFLSDAARVTAAPVSIHVQRIETVYLPPVATVTVRALAPLPKLLALAKPFLQPDGVLLCLKGRNAKQELTAARAQWHMHVTAIPSRTDATGSILQISEIRRVR
jgi:16S rRNA (guanine527-N7)-methyltransferase